MSSVPSVRIGAARAASRGEWEQACVASTSATFFHTPFFADFFRRTGTGYATPATQKIEFSDGATAVIPLMCKSFPAGFLRMYASMPAVCYGGWIPSPDLSLAHGRALTAHMHGFGDLIWRENPYDPLLSGIDINHTEDDFTQAVDLREGFAAVSGRFDYAHRKAVKKALSAGVTVAEASNRGQWKSYFSLYSQSRARWRHKGLLRSRGYDESLIDAVYECPAEYRKLWIASVDGRPAAGIICFYWKQHAVAWLGAGSAEFFGCRPNNLLYEHAIRHAAEAGFLWFDCNPSGGLAGVVEFKSHLGAQKMRSRIVNKRSRLRRVAEYLRSMTV